MSKSYRPWYGRPNKPPENWHTPDSPVVRRVIWRSGDDADSEIRDLVVVSFKSEAWVRILKALYLYGQAYDDEEWHTWYGLVRRVILRAVDSYLDDRWTKVEVSLDIEEWRKLWQAVRTACYEYNEDWVRWFRWLTQQMTKQIERGN